MPEIPPNSSEAMAGTKTIKGCVACASSWLGKTKINDLLFHSHWAEITNNSLFLITEFFFIFETRKKWAEHGTGDEHAAVICQNIGHFPQTTPKKIKINSLLLCTLQKLKPPALSLHP